MIEYIFLFFYGTPCSLLSQQSSYNIGILEVSRCSYILLLSRILFKMEGYFKESYVYYKYQFSSNKKKKKPVIVDTNFILHNIYFIIISWQNKIQMTKETWMNVLQCFENSNTANFNNKKFIKQTVYL